MQEELQLADHQIAALQAAVAEVDEPFWLLRDVPMEKCREQLQALYVKLWRRIAATLTGEQSARFDQITLQARGFKALVSSEIAERLKLTPEQTAAIAGLLAGSQPSIGGQETGGGTSAGARRAGSSQTSTTNPAAAKPASRAESRAPTSQEILDLLEPRQKVQLDQMAGQPFDFSHVKRIGCQAPELRGLDGWINSEPLSLAALRGKVVAVHFWAFGCINCVHNLPHYQAWFEKFPRSRFTIVGIHTPETEQERSIVNLRENVLQRGIAYPVAVDGASANWKAWGNQVWPSVYLVDKQGHVRYWWYGELNWEGAGGEAFMRQKIEELLAEK